MTIIKGQLYKNIKHIKNFLKNIQLNYRNIKQLVGSYIFNKIAGCIKNKEIRRARLTSEMRNKVIVDKDANNFQLQDQGCHTHKGSID